VTILLNALRASTVRRVSPWSGAWSADVELDLDLLPDLPTGPAVLTIDTTPLVCTIDPEQSGRFGSKARARVVGGRRGWEQSVPAQHFKNDGGILSTTVLTATGLLVGEVVVDSAPTFLPADYVRPEGPASSVLQGRPWRIDATGTTIVGPRIPLPALPTSVQVLEWDPRTRVATIASDAIIEPGLVLVDPRFGTALIRDVEQTWGDGGTRATAWTMPLTGDPAAAGTELVATVAAIAREAVGSTYRAGQENVPVKKTSGLPPLKVTTVDPAFPGVSIKVTPGTIARVIFLEGDRTLPRVVGFEKTPKPIEIAFDAAKFSIGTGVKPIACAPELIAWALNVNAALNGLGVPVAPLAPSVASTKGFTE
jgi:hypothetical protein